MSHSVLIRMALVGGISFFALLAWEYVYATRYREKSVKLPVGFLLIVVLGVFYAASFFGGAEGIATGLHIIRISGPVARLLVIGGGFAATYLSVGILCACQNIIRRRHGLRPNLIWALRKSARRK